MDSKLFHIGDVISVATGRLVSPRHMTGVCDILQFMCDESPFSHQIARFIRECEPFILCQYPQFALPAFQPALDELDTWLQRGTREQASELVQEWLLKVLGGSYGVKDLKLAGSAGDMLIVEKLPLHHHERIDPESEALEKFPPHRIIKL